MTGLLVTGGGGFVMCHLARHWVGCADANFAVVVDRDPLDAAARDWFAPCGDRIRFVRGDVADPAFWADLPARIADLPPVRCIAHGAAVSSIERHRRAGGLAAALPAIEANIMAPPARWPLPKRCRRCAGFSTCPRAPSMRATPTCRWKRRCPKMATSHPTAFIPHRNMRPNFWWVRRRATADCRRSRSGWRPFSARWTARHRRARSTAFQSV